MMLHMELRGAKLELQLGRDSRDSIVRVRGNDIVPCLTFMERRISHLGVPVMYDDSASRPATCRPVLVVQERSWGQVPAYKVLK